MDYKLELVLIPVSDTDQAKHFYVEQAGFDLLVDTPTGLPEQRVVQVTPPGSACSIGFGTGVTPAEPGSQQGLHLVVPDIVAARAELTARGVEVGEVRHIAGGAWTPGPDPQRRSYMSFAEFTDPDGNLWLLQEVRRDQQRQGDDW
jgi:catechol 2,3-dioxygenase-like lactoylglutathione lyase family enzyme